ncbi:hypothetical protein WJX75_008854 [Coccomyxa subellipsoidea]|uniref:Cyclic nucleotide-binding domain-containing protein n=1 Tax=Coccomyxa subellipsoidea TaxID=248742 RepID=A0ABR2Z1K3_9CHLO
MPQSFASFEDESGLLNALGHCFLSQDLDDEQKQDVIGAMFRRDVRAQEIIIREGEAADNLYVIQSGVFEAFKTSKDGERVLFKYEGAGAFGELALMYNCPRAATVRAVTDGVLWVMERSTFRTIVLAARMQMRQRYEEVLADMAIFQDLTPANRSSIADCLIAEVYQEGEDILREGEPLAKGSKFYIIEEGTVECCKTIQGEKRSVGTMGPGRFFGEIALVRQHSRRAADCIARERTKVLALSRDAFERLMGPAEKILAEQVAQYDRANSDLSGEFSFGRHPRASFL